MIEMGEEKTQEKRCIVIGCNNPLPRRPGKFKICDKCRESVLAMLQETGRSLDHENVRKQISHFIKSGLSLGGYKNKLMTRKPTGHRKKQESTSGIEESMQDLDNSECPLISTCPLADVASEEDVQCHDGRHDECSAYNKQITDQIKEQVLKKPKEDEIMDELDETTPIIDNVQEPGEDSIETGKPEIDHENETGDQHVVIASSEDPKPDVEVAKSTDDHLIQEIIAPIMTALKNASNLLVDKGILPRPARIDKESVNIEVSKLTNAFKQEITEMLADFRQTMRNYIAIELKKTTKDFIETQATIKEAVRVEVADRFRFMTASYEDHAKQLEAEGKERKRKELQKEMREMQET